MESEGLAAHAVSMMYGNGEGQNTKHYYAGDMNKKKKKTKSKSKGK